MNVSLIIDNGLNAMVPIGIRDSYNNAQIIDIFNSRNDVSSAVISQYYKIKKNVEYQSVGKNSLYPLNPNYKGTGNSIIYNYYSRQYFARTANKYALFRRVLDLSFLFIYNIKRNIPRPIKLIHFTISSDFTGINGDYNLYEYHPYIDKGKVYQNTTNGYFMYYNTVDTEWFILGNYIKSSRNIDNEEAYAFLRLSNLSDSPLQDNWLYGKIANSIGGIGENNDPIGNFTITTYIEN